VLDTEVEHLKKKDEKMSDRAAKKAATDSLVLALTLRHYIEANGIRATEEDVKAYIAIAAPSQVSPDMFYEWYAQDKERIGQIRAAVVEQKAFDHILSGVKTKVVTRSISDIEAELKEEV
jgi:FKBP-type peptidyl-prolyl cis-trans isomerase (trigger factor)